MQLDRRELQLIEPLRTLRLLHYSAWIARRWDDPRFPGRVPVVQHAALLAGPDPRAARADRADDGAAGRDRLVLQVSLERSGVAIERSM